MSMICTVASDHLYITVCANHSALSFIFHILFLRNAVPVKYGLLRLAVISHRNMRPLPCREEVFCRADCLNKIRLAAGWPYRETKRCIPIHIQIPAVFLELSLAPCNNLFSRNICIRFDPEREAEHFGRKLVTGSKIEIRVSIQ